MVSFFPASTSAREIAQSPVAKLAGIATVVNTQILTQLVEVVYESGERQAWPLDEIEVTGKQEKNSTSPTEQEEMDDQSPELQVNTNNAEQKNGSGLQDGGINDSSDKPGNQKKPSRQNNWKKKRGRRKNNNNNSKPNGGNRVQNQTGKD